MPAFAYPREPFGVPADGCGLRLSAPYPVQGPISLSPAILLFGRAIPCKAEVR